MERRNFLFRAALGVAAMAIDPTQLIYVPRRAFSIPKVTYAEMGLVTTISRPSGAKVVHDPVDCGIVPELENLGLFYRRATSSEVQRAQVLLQAPPVSNAEKWDLGGLNSADDKLCSRSIGFDDAYREEA